MIEINPKTAALVLIDLQKGILGRDLKPYSASRIIEVSIDLADRFRSHGALVVPVKVDFAKDFIDAPRQVVDEPTVRPPGGFPENFCELMEGIAKPGDVRITKRQWGAFYGTELDLQLRRRGIDTIVLGGVATNMGVESTARQAWELGYSLITVEDAISGMDEDMHSFAIKKIFPRLSRVVKSNDVTFAKT